MGFSLSEVPRTLYLFLDDAFGEDEQLAIGDVYELHARELQWRAVCIEGSEIHQRLQLLERKNIRTIPVSPRRFLDRNLREVLRSEIENGIGLVHAWSTNHLGSILPGCFATPECRWW